MTTATPAKLRDGSWGARVAGPVKSGDTVEVKTKVGKTWTAVVTAVLWTGEGGTVSLCSTRSTQAATRSGRCHTDGDCSSLCNPHSCPCGDGVWFRCC